MTQEEKELLLTDLCSRLPYDVCVHIRYKTGEPCYGKLTPRDIQWLIDSKIENIKPYLRPMSSMTEKEKKEFLYLTNWDENDLIDIVKYPHMYEFTISLKAFDWLNAHHFDYRGLIEKGLALEAPEDMYK